jgi:hypothetical protein
LYFQLRLGFPSGLHPVRSPQQKPVCASPISHTFLQASWNVFTARYELNVYYRDEMTNE